MFIHEEIFKKKEAIVSYQKEQETMSTLARAFNDKVARIPVCRDYHLRAETAANVFRMFDEFPGGDSMAAKKDTKETITHMLQTMAEHVESASDKVENPQDAADLKSYAGQIRTVIETMGPKPLS